MKTARKWLSLLLALLMVMSLMTTAFAANSNESLKGSIVILHTNDVHGAIDGYATVAALKRTCNPKARTCCSLTQAIFCRAALR